MIEVNDAIILAGGRGTRMLPSSSYVPKEIMPLIDTPIINHLIWEACKAGVERIHLVVSPAKKDILSKVFNNKWHENIRQDLPRVALDPVPNNVEILLHEQSNPGGVGDAILCATKYIDGPFLVLLGDNLLIENHVSPQKSGPMDASNGCKLLVDHYKLTGVPCAGILEVADSEINKYGIVEFENNLIKNIIEKPDIKDAPSNYILCGRYLLPPDSEKILNLYPSKEYGELQSIVFFNHLIENFGFGTVNMNNFTLYDSGDPINWLKAQIDHSLKRNDLEKEMREWLNDRILID